MGKNGDFLNHIHISATLPSEESALDGAEGAEGPKRCWSGMARRRDCRISVTKHTFLTNAGVYAFPSSSHASQSILNVIHGRSLVFQLPLSVQVIVRVSTMLFYLYISSIRRRRVGKHTPTAPEVQLRSWSHCEVCASGCCLVGWSGIRVTGEVEGGSCERSGGSVVSRASAP